MFTYCVFDLSVYYLFLQYIDTVGWVFCPVKTVTRITYIVLEETLNPAQSINQSSTKMNDLDLCLEVV